jgi:hypothetical protein
LPSRNMTSDPASGRPPKQAASLSSCFSRHFWGRVVWSRRGVSTARMCMQPPSAEACLSSPGIKRSRSRAR